MPEDHMLAFHKIEEGLAGKSSLTSFFRRSLSRYAACG
jgi:hypothetical protein